MPFSGFGAQSAPRRGCIQRLPTMRLAGEFSRRTVHIFLEHRGEVSGIAESATLSDFRDVQARIEQGLLGHLDPLPDQKLLQGHSRCATKYAAEMPAGKMNRSGQLLNRDVGRALLLDKLCQRLNN